MKKNETISIYISFDTTDKFNKQNELKSNNNNNPPFVHVKLNDVLDHMAYWRRSCSRNTSQND